MLLKQDTLAGIQDGSITLAFRRWKRPTVKAGGTLLTRIGQLSIEAVDKVDPKRITTAQAQASGFADAASLRALLDTRTTGDVYRVKLSLAGEDPRAALRKAVPKGAELEKLLVRLERLGVRAATGPWALAVLELIAAQPAVRAGDLAEDFGMEKAPFKSNVRTLKGMGLTESLEVGYRLSPRGKVVLKHLRKR